MLNQKKDKNKPKEPKRDRDHDLTCLSVHFLGQFLSLSFFEIFWCFSWFRKLPMDPNWCFFMPWWSRDHPRLILDRFGKTHFFMKIFIFLTEILTPSSTKTHMYIHNLVNLRVPRPQATQNAKTKWNLSNAKRAVNRQPGYRAEDS